MVQDHLKVVDDKVEGSTKDCEERQTLKGVRRGKVNYLDDWISRDLLLKVALWGNGDMKVVDSIKTGGKYEDTNRLTGGRGLLSEEISGKVKMWSHLQDPASTSTMYVYSC